MSNTFDIEVRALVAYLDSIEFHVDAGIVQGLYDTTNIQYKKILELEAERDSLKALADSLSSVIKQIDGHVSKIEEVKNND